MEKLLYLVTGATGVTSGYAVNSLLMLRKAVQIKALPEGWRNAIQESIL